jgi:hypothetical protein
MINRTFRREDWDAAMDTELTRQRKLKLTIVYPGFILILSEKDTWMSTLYWCNPGLAMAN